MKKLVFFSLLFCSFATVKAQWSDQNAGFVNKTLGFYEFSIVNENTVWVICYDGFGGLFGPNPTLDFTRTIDGGTTWIPGVVGTDMTLAFSNISAISATEAWVAMHRFGSSAGGGGGLFHTTNAGLTWTQSNAALIFNDASYPNFVYFKDAMNGIAGGNVNDGYFEIYKTNNGGLTWARTPQANFPALVSGGNLGWFNGYAVIGDTIWFGTTQGQIYKSIDFGLNWTSSTVSSIQGDRVFEIAFLDNGLNGLTHVRNGSSTKLFATTDGGLTWTQRLLSTIPNWRRDRITAIPGTTTFVSTSTNNTRGGSAYSTNNGLNWTLIESTTQKAACRFLNNSTGWAGGFFSDNPQVGNRPGIYKWDNSINLTTKSNELLEKKIKIYPNPAKDNITISFTENLKNNTKIEVIDLLGRISISELFDNQYIGNQIKIDISKLAKGNYIVKITSDNEFITKKFIVL